MLLSFLSISLLLLLPEATLGYSTFRDEIPNGKMVPHPCKPNVMWKGVGHFNVDGGGFRNPFGLAFYAAGKKWTKELCANDSDGDGRSNGQELGDPDCTWKPNDVPKLTSQLSHPGICEPMDSTLCRQKTFDSGPFKTQEEWMIEACQSGQFVCEGLNDTAVRNQTIRIPRTQVPADETTYMCAIFDFQDANEDVHLIATTPVLDNLQVMHHMLLSGCEGEIQDQEIGVPYVCGMSAHSNCSTIIGIWTVGQNGECVHPNAGFRMGRNGYKRIALQYHWNNPEKASHYNDSSGMTLYYTSKLRSNDAGVLMIGDGGFVIPPRKPETVVKSVCTSGCTQNMMAKPMFVTAAWNHMHYLGFRQNIEHFRNDIALRNFTDDVTYSYDSPKTYFYDTPVDVRPGDVLKTTCYFNSMSRTFTTTFGESTQQEMCFGFIYYYPKDALKQDSCVTYGDVAYCDNITLNGCDPTSFSQRFLQYLYKNIVNNCTVFGRCYEECKSAILEARKMEPCMTNKDYWQFFTQKLVEGGDTKFVGSIASCEVEIAIDALATTCNTTQGSTYHPDVCASADSVYVRGVLLVLMLLFHRL